MIERHDHTPVALYARVSSDRQDVDLSVAAQLRALRDYAQKKDYMIVREYVDEAESGRIGDRPQFPSVGLPATPVECGRDRRGYGPSIQATPYFGATKVKPVDGVSVAVLARMDHPGPGKAKKLECE